MIPVTVRDVHGREVLAVPVYPFDQVVGLAGRQECVDKDGVTLARDQRRRDGRPESGVLSRGQVVCGQRFCWRYVDVPAEYRGSLRGSSVMTVSVG
jgi:hypothetical protein